LRGSEKVGGAQYKIFPELGHIAAHEHIGDPLCGLALFEHIAEFADGERREFGNAATSRPGYPRFEFRLGPEELDIGQAIRHSVRVDT